MSKRKIFVLTYVEGGWDNVRGVFEATSEDEVRQHKMEEYTMTEEDFENKYVIHEVYNGIQKL